MNGDTVWRAWERANKDKHEVTRLIRKNPYSDMWLLHVRLLHKRFRQERAFRADLKARLRRRDL